jgi:formate--tetrahydrofolate ligase
VTGAFGVVGQPAPEAKARMYEEKYPDFYTMMAKTQSSLSHDPDLKGVPRGWMLPVRDVLVFAGARFLVPMCGDIKLVPGTSSDPAFRRIDVDVNTGAVQGLF